MNVYVRGKYDRQQMAEVCLKFLDITSLRNWSIKDTVVCEEPNLGVDTFHDIVDEDHENRGPRTVVPCGTPDLTHDQGDD